MSEDPRIEAVARVIRRRLPQAFDPITDWTWAVDDARAALAAADAAAWRPVSEVPHEGKFLCYCPHLTDKNKAITTEVHRREGKWVMDRSLADYKLPTHFMPLPTPPQEQDI